MNRDLLEIYKKMHEKSLQITKYIKNVVKENESAIKIAEKIERNILEEFDLAFPVNISINEKTAHYSPSLFEDYLIPEKSVVKIDYGIMKDGFILDRAFTISFDEKYQEIIELNERIFEMLDEIIKVGLEIKELGKSIEEFVDKHKKNHKIKIIENLSGHFLGRFILHKGTIPNTKNNYQGRLKEGDIFAIEPFLSLGRGRVEDDKNFCSIYLLKDGNIRNPIARELINKIPFKTLPFIDRWIEMDKNKLKLAINLLMKENKLHCFYGLKDNNITTQTEYTYLITEDEVLRLG